MNISDILGVVEIVVTILFGYYITHRVSVRDTRIRTVKDLYLSQLNDIKKNVDYFFDSLFKGKLQGRAIADWYGHQQSSLICFDEGLRMSLRIRKEKLEDVVNKIHEEITGSDFYNDNFNKKNYILSNTEQAKMLELKYRIDKSFNEYVVHINNSRQYYFWETIKQNYCFDVDYYTNCKKSKYPNFRAITVRFVKVLVFSVALFISTYLIYDIFISSSNKTNLDLNENPLECYSDTNVIIDDSIAVSEDIVKKQ